MYRKQPSPSKSLIIAAALALTASGVAFADDSSMSMWTGDSYAYFNNLDNHPGKFNTARAPRMEAPSPVAKAPAKENKADERVVLATRPSRGTPTNPFRDDTGA
jgi:hypothetical protein